MKDMPRFLCEGCTRKECVVTWKSGCFPVEYNPATSGSLVEIWEKEAVEQDFFAKAHSNPALRNMYKALAFMCRKHAEELRGVKENRKTNIQKKLKECDLHQQVDERDERVVELRCPKQAASACENVADTILLQADNGELKQIAARGTAT